MNTNDIRATKERSSRSSKENVISKKYSVKKPRKKDIAHAVATLTNVNVSFLQEVSVSKFKFVFIGISWN